MAEVNGRPCVCNPHTKVPCLWHHSAARPRVKHRTWRQVKAERTRRG